MHIGYTSKEIKRFECIYLKNETKQKLKIKVLVLTEDIAQIILPKNKNLNIPNMCSCIKKLSIAEIFDSRAVNNS